MSTPVSKLGRAKVQLCPAACDQCMTHAQEACECIDLGRFSKDQMPSEVVVQIFYALNMYSVYNKDKWAPIAYWLRLMEFRTPTYVDFRNVTHCERKVNCY